MARTLTVAERAAVAAPHHGAFSKFEVQDADGVYRDYTQYLRTDWFTGASIEESIDQNTMTLNATLLRETGTLSLSPFVAASLINRNAGGSYATAIDAWRKWRLSLAVMREGYPPTGTDWKETCQGRIDIIEWSGEQINITGRGEEAVLLDFWIATERQYGSVGGIAMETVIQSLNDNNLVALSPALYTPVSPSYLMNAWTQQKGNLFPADVAVASKAGAVIRYRYDASDVNRLTLLKPNRTATPGSEVWTLSPSEYTKVLRVAIDKSGIRNFIKLRFVHPTLGIQTVIYPHMAGTGTVACTAGVATFSSSQAGIIKAAADGSNTEIIVAGIAYTVTAFNGTTGATLLSQLATGGVPAFGASAFTLHDTLSGAGTTTSLSRFGRIDEEFDLSYDTQVNDSTKAQGMCDAIGSDQEFPDLEQQFETLGAWFIQLYDYGKFEANPQLYDSPQYGGVTRIRHDIADATIKTTIDVRGKPAGGYKTWKMLAAASAPSGAIAQQALRDTKPIQLKVMRQSETADQIVSRVYAIASVAGATVSLAYDNGGLTVTPASPQTLVATTDFATTGFVDFTITRDKANGTPRRIAFGGSAPGYVDGTDGVDVSPTSTRFRAKAAITISLANNSATFFAPTTEVYDVGNLHDNSTNPSHFTVPTGGDVGAWVLSGSVSFANNATGYRSVGIYKNGALTDAVAVVQAVTSGVLTAVAVVFVDSVPAVNDYYELLATQTSGGALSTTGTFTATHLP
jgi:hypothetical protein